MAFRKWPIEQTAFRTNDHNSKFPLEQIIFREKFCFKQMSFMTDAIYNKC